MSNHARLYRTALIAVLAFAFVASAVGCATKGYVRQETQKTAATLSARIDGNDKSIEQNTEQIRAQSNQISELASLNKQNTQKLETLDSDVAKVDGKATQARTSADQAQQTAGKATTQVAALDERFVNRNRYGVLVEKFVYFGLNSAALDSSYEQDLLEVVRIAKENPDAVIAVEGRADGSGEADYNIRLGEQRMDAVVRFLVVAQGVPMHKVHKMSFGEASPLADNESKDGRAKNRCAVVRVMAPPAAGRS